MAYQITYSGHIYTMDEIMSAEVYLSNSMISEELAADEFTFSVTSGTDLSNYIYGSPVILYNNETNVTMRFFVTNVSRMSASVYEFNCISAVGMLIYQTHLGGVYNGISAKALIQDICSQLNVTMTFDSRLETTLLYGWLPIASCRDNLVQVLFAIGANVMKNDDGSLYFCFFTPESGKDVDGQIYMGAKNNYTTKPTKVSVTEHAFLQGVNTQAEEIYNNLSDDDVLNAIIKFNEPYYDFHAYNASGTEIADFIVESNANYIKVGTATYPKARVTAKKYVHNMNVKSYSNPSASIDASEATVTDMTLVSSANSDNCLKRVANYYFNANEMSADLLMDGERPSNRIKYTDPYDNTSTTGVIKSMNANLSTNAKANISVLTNWIPRYNGNSYNRFEIITSDDLVEGVYTVPQSIVGKEAMVVLFGGMGGGQAGYNGTDGESKSYVYPDVSGYNTYVPSAGVGGNGGSHGSYGNYIKSTINSLASSYTVSFGTGGNGGTANGALGSSGTDSTFGSISTSDGIQLESNYTNLVNGQFLTYLGDDGVRGGDGGSTHSLDSKGATIESSSSGIWEWRKYAQIGYDGESVGQWSGGSGIHGETVWRTDNDKYYEDAGSGGGGAAYGVSGGNATGHYGVTGGIAPTQGGRGATPSGRANALLGYTGAGGHGGGGGGAGAMAIGDTGGMYNTFLNSEGRGGSGGSGGKGSDGFAILYYNDDLEYVSTPVPKQDIYTFNGDIASPQWYNYNAIELTIGGTYQATESGTYTATFTPNTGYAWTDTGTSELREVQWTLSNRYVKIPTLSGSFTYDGTVKEPTITGYNALYMTQTGVVSSTDAGEFTVVYELIDTVNTCWWDGTLSPKTYTWSIAKAAQAVTVASATATVNEGDSVGVNASAMTAITVTSSDTSKATATYNNGLVTISGISSGTVTITVSAEDTNNYYSASATITVNIFITSLVNTTWTVNSDATYGSSSVKQVSGTTHHSGSYNTFSKIYTPLFYQNFLYNSVLYEVRCFGYKFSGNTTLNTTIYYGLVKNNGTYEPGMLAVTKSNGNIKVVTPTYGTFEYTFTGGSDIGNADVLTWVSNNCTRIS